MSRSVDELTTDIIVEWIRAKAKLASAIESVAIQKEIFESIEDIDSLLEIYKKIRSTIEQENN